MYYRFDRQLKSKELSAHTLATFMVLQGASDPAGIGSEISMPSAVLRQLIRGTAFSYWKKNGWLQQSGDSVSLTSAGSAKVADRLSGRDGGYSVGRDDVQYMADVIRRGPDSPFAGGESLEEIPAPKDAAPLPRGDSGAVRPVAPADTALSTQPPEGLKEAVRLDSRDSRASTRAQAAQPLPVPGSRFATTSAERTSRSQPSPAALYRQLEDLGRVQLSKNFYMRDFLYSEIAYAEAIPNLPEDPDLAVAAGKQLCERVLEPLQAGVGRLAIRSAYRSPTVNAKGAANNNQYNCAGNDRNRAAHIWDLPDESGRMGATACVVVPSFQSYYQRTGDWTSLAWWIYDHVHEFHSLFFFPRLAAFNIRWLEGAAPRDSIRTYVKNPNTGDKKPLVVGGAPVLGSSARVESWNRAFG